MLIAFFAACQEPDPVLVEGVVWSGPESTAPPLPDASVTFVDETGAILDAVQAGPDGVFRASVPAGVEMFAEITAPGHALTTFPGVSGIADTFEVEDHALYGMSLEERDAILERFAGCPGADEGGPLVTGEIRLYVVDEQGDSPLVTTGAAAVGKHTACYLDWSGSRYQPKVSETGNSGAFAVFGVGPGLRTLSIGYQPFPDQWSIEEYRVWIPDEPDVVSPWYPAWVELVF